MSEEGSFWVKCCISEILGRIVCPGPSQRVGEAILFIEGFFVDYIDFQIERFICDHLDFHLEGFIKAGLAENLQKRKRLLRTRA